MRHVPTALLSPKFWQRSLCLLGISSLLTLNSCTRYDIDIADSPNNQSGFEYHLGQAPTAEISGIYYYANELGADVSYQLRFEATEATVQPLIQSLGLSNEFPAIEQAIARTDFSWWNADQIEALRPYWKTNGSEDYYWILWFDETAEEAFFLEFSL